MPRPPRAVVFDWGGVILRICRGFAEGCERAGVRYRGVPEDEQLRAHRRALVASYQRGELSSAAYYEGTSAAFGGLYSAEEIARIDHAWLIAEYAGIDAVLTALAATDVRTALLSNTSEGHFVRGVGPSADFPAIGLLGVRVASHIEGCAKPEPAIYERAEAALDARGDAVLFFDDLETNTAAALARGWRATTIDPSGDTAAQVLDTLRASGIAL